MTVNMGDKIRIVLEGFRKEFPVSDLCRREDISTTLYYSWLKDFMEAGKARLKGDSLWDATKSEVKKLREENSHYKWRRNYDEDGIVGLRKEKTGPKRTWNRLNDAERARVLEIARLHPELSSRLLSFKIIDEEAFSVSEATVYRILKEEDLIFPKPLPEMPAAKEWRHKTTHPDQIWQCDATNIFVVGWGYYKLIP